MRTGLIITLAAVGCTLLTSCKSGYNRPYRPPADEPVSTVAPACSTAPATTTLDQQTRSAYRYIQRLSCNDPDLDTGADGVIAGHSIYYGDDSSLRASAGYTEFVTAVGDRGGAPAMLAFDYETGHGVSLPEVNVGVLNFWQSEPGTMVMINWLPGDPLDPGAGPAFDAEVDINLEQLVDGTDSAAAGFKAQLDQVAQALIQLRENNVTVLFNPLPSPNTNDYWWGTGNSYVAAGSGATTPTSTYLELYREVRQYLVSVAITLPNVLWLYSPAEDPADDKPSALAAPPKWTYPGEAQVDIVSPIVRNDYLVFDNYEDIVSWNKPMGFAAFGPGDITQSEFSEETPFSFTSFRDALREDYNAAGFVVTPYNTYFDANPSDDVEPLEGSASFYGFEGWNDSFASTGLFSSSDLTEVNWRGTAF